MAVSTYGAFEYAGGNGMRVGMSTVTWSAVTSTSTTVTATVEIYTENQYTYADSQTLTYSGNISGTTAYTNNQGAGLDTLRATKTYTYTYAAGSYGTSPGTATFTATVSGTYNGVTPSHTITSDIPARPGGIISVCTDTSPVVWTDGIVYVCTDTSPVVWTLAQARVCTDTSPVVWSYGI